MIRGVVFNACIVCMKPLYGDCAALAGDNGGKRAVKRAHGVLEDDDGEAVALDHACKVFGLDGALAGLDAQDVSAVRGNVRLAVGVFDGPSDGIEIGGWCRPLVRLCTWLQRPSPAA